MLTDGSYGKVCREKTTSKGASSTQLGLALQAPSSPTAQVPAVLIGPATVPDWSANSLLSSVWAKYDDGPQHQGGGSLILLGGEGEDLIICGEAA